MDVKPYRQQEMYELGEGNERSCSFDFSKISIDEYYPFFNGLPNFIYKKIEKLKFDTDLYHSYDDNDKEMSEEDQIYLLNSIKTKKNKYPHYLFKILNATLPKSIKLTSLSIDGIRIPTTYFDGFVKSAARCHPLKVLKIENSPLSTDQFLKILRQWTPYHFEVLSFKRDRLNPSEVSEDIAKYLEQTSSKTWKLEILALDDNDFPSKQLANFKNAINDQLDQQGNSQITRSQKSKSRQRTSKNDSRIEHSNFRNKIEEEEKIQEQEYDQILEEEEEEEEEELAEEEEEYIEEEEEEEEEYEEDYEN